MFRWKIGAFARIILEKGIKQALHSEFLYEKTMAAYLQKWPSFTP